MVAADAQFHGIPQGSKADHGAFNSRGEAHFQKALPQVGSKPYGGDLPRLARGQFAEGDLGGGGWGFHAG